MPMGFCAIIGGTITLVGASPTILLNDLMVLGGKKLEPFGLFTQTPIGICLLSSAILYFVIFGKFVLPAAEGEADKGVTASLMEDYQGLEHTFEIHIPDNFDGPRTLQELAIRPKFLVTVVAISYSAKRKKVLCRKAAIRFLRVMILPLSGRIKMFKCWPKNTDGKIKDGLDVFGESLAVTNAGMAETVVSPRSELIGKTMSEVNFKELYGVNPVALFKGNKIIYSDLTHIRLQMGDTLLLQGPWERFHILRNQPQPGP